MPVDRPQLFYTQAHVPLEYMLGWFQPLESVWSVFDDASVSTYCQAKGIPFHVLNHKKQNDFWKRAESQAPPSLLYMGFQESPSLQFQQFTRMVDWMSSFCGQRQVPLLLNRSAFSINEVPWLLPHSEKTPSNFPLLEVGSVASTHGEQLNRIVLSGSQEWREYLAHLPGFISRTPHADHHDTSSNDRLSTERPYPVLHRV
jgi:hypothetical protein